jgi:hypothetical protein
MTDLIKLAAIQWSFQLNQNQAEIKKTIKTFIKLKKQKNKEKKKVITV